MTAKVRGQIKRLTPMPTFGSNSQPKVVSTKGIAKVLDYFRYTTGTTLDCAFATGVLRNSITYYVRDLEREKMLMAVYIAPDSTTGRRAKHYSANEEVWNSYITGGRKEAIHGE